MINVFRVVQLPNNKFAVKTNEDSLNTLLLTSFCNIEYDDLHTAQQDADMCFAIRSAIAALQGLNRIVLVDKAKLDSYMNSMTNKKEGLSPDSSIHLTLSDSIRHINICLEQAKI